MATTWLPPHSLLRPPAPPPPPCAGCNEGTVPLLRWEDGDAADGLAEERRLFYVSLTRAKQRLQLSHTRVVSHFGRENRRVVGGGTGGGRTQAPFAEPPVRACFKGACGGIPNGGVGESRKACEWAPAQRPWFVYARWGAAQPWAGRLRWRVWPAARPELAWRMSSCRPASDRPLPTLLPHLCPALSFRREAEVSRFLGDVIKAGHAVVRNSEDEGSPPPSHGRSPWQQRFGGTHARGRAGLSDGRGRSSSSSSSSSGTTASLQQQRQQQQPGMQQQQGQKPPPRQQQQPSQQQQQQLSAAQLSALKRGGRR